MIIVAEFDKINILVYSLFIAILYPVFSRETQIQGKTPNISFIFNSNVLISIILVQEFAEIFIFVNDNTFVFTKSL